MGACYPETAAQNHTVGVGAQLIYDRMMKLYVARHGRTNYNDLGLCNADPRVDVRLTDIGKQQAEVLGNKLRDIAIDRIYVSELKRTQETAAYVNKHHNVPVKIDARLNDNRTGYEGRPASEFYAAYEQAHDKWNARFNDGESLEDVNKRVRSFIDELRKQPYKVVIIITSGAIVNAIRGVVKGLSNQEAYGVEDIQQGSFIELDLE
jgi:alpha-ribazole phosphatase